MSSCETQKTFLCRTRFIPHGVRLNIKRALTLWNKLMYARCILHGLNLISCWKPKILKILGTKNLTLKQQGSSMSHQLLWPLPVFLAYRISSIIDLVAVLIKAPVCQTGIYVAIETILTKCNSMPLVRLGLTICLVKSSYFLVRHCINKVTLLFV